MVSCHHDVHAQAGSLGNISSFVFFGWTKTEKTKTQIHKNTNNKLAKLGDAIAILKSETIND